MLLLIIKKPTEENESTGDNDDTKYLDEAISIYYFYFQLLLLYVDESLKLKVKFVTMMMKMYKTLREEKELIVKLKGCCPGNKIPRGLLIQGPDALKSAYERYNRAKEYDLQNEKRP